MSERKVFEVVASSLGCQMDKWEDGSYVNKNTELSFRVWQASANREGYKLVPIEPTDEM